MFYTQLFLRIEILKFRKRLDLYYDSCYNVINQGGRMNKSKTVILRVEPELKARLIAEAERQGITLSKHIRQILIAASRKRE